MKGGGRETRKIVAGFCLVLLFAALVLSSYQGKNTDALEGQTADVAPSDSGFWYQGEVIYIYEFPAYDIIYVLGTVDSRANIHVTIIRQMPATFSMYVNEGDYLRLGDELYKIEDINLRMGRVAYERT